MAASVQGVTTQSEQQVVPVPTVPPRAVQPSLDDLILHRAPQSRSVVQGWLALLVHNPVVKSQVSVGIRQVTKPDLPQVDLAAQRWILPLHSFGMAPLSRSRFSACATQLTY